MSRSKKRAPKSRSGPTITPEERAKRGYGRVTFSLPNTTSDLVDRFAARHGCTRSAVIAMALGALVQVEGMP